MLKEKLKKYNVILASGSPRRQLFFKEMDIDFSIQLKEVEEVYPSHLQAAEITDYLAELKANAFKTCLDSNDLLVTSDTLVWLEGTALGKPKDRKDAFEMLTCMAGKTHQVITSVCLMNLSFTNVFHEITNVTFKALTSDEIEYYLDTYQPYDKAGSYGIQEWIGLIAIEKIEGSYANVVGLPTHRLYKELMQL